MEDREAGFQREMMFCKLNTVMPRLRFPPKGRWAKKIYKVALVTESIVAMTVAMINTHGINGEERVTPP